MDHHDAPATNDRTGAIWVTAAGALLLFAAAATFVAVRWDQLHEWQKFAGLLAVTQLLLVGGWVGRRRVPATSAAVFSLGAVLVPLDAWTAAASGTGTWQRGLFVGGVVGVAALPVARRLFDTVALRWAWVVAVPVACAGTAAWFGFVPPAVVLAALGLVALSAGRRRDGLVWLALGAVAPIATLSGPVLPVGTGVLDDLGLVGAALPWTTAATAVLLVAAVVINGRKLGRTDLIAAGGALALVDAAAALRIGDAGAGGWWFAAAATFLGIQIAATLAGEDRFWRRRLAPVAEIALRIAGFGFPLVVVGMFASTPGGGWFVGRGEAAITSLTVAIGWLVSDEREGRRRRDRTGLADVLTGAASTTAGWAFAAYATLGLAVLPVSRLAAWAAVGALGAALLLGRRAGGAVTGTALLGLAAIGAVVLGTAGDTAVGVACLIAMAVGVRRHRDDAAALLAGIAATGGLAAAAVAIPIAHLTADPGGQFVTDIRLSIGVAILGLVMGSLAAVGRRTAPAVPMQVAAALGALPTFLTASTPWVATVVTTAVVAWLLAEALRHRSDWPAWIAAATSPAVTGGLVASLGFGGARLGVGIATGAIVVVGISLLTSRAVRPFLLGSALLHLVVGAAFAAAEPGPLGAVVTIAGLLLVAVALVEQHVVLGYNGAVLALLGTWQMLFGHRVDVAEAYIAPAALLMVIAGAHARTVRPLSSWVAYAPAVVALGGASFILRIDGAPGWHGVVAGAVAVAAIAAGSAWRLAGPLLTGSALLAALTVTETVTRTAGVPTWIWLAAGGTALLGSGIAMELRGLGPVESGRRVVELVGERFD